LYSQTAERSATLIAPPAPPTPTGPSQEDIRKVIAEHKAREEKKASASKTDDKDKEKEKEKPSSPIPPSSPSPAPAPTATPSHRKFALHRQIFDMRREDIKRKEQGVKAREVGKGESIIRDSE
jgi:hypothetical protein